MVSSIIKSVGSYLPSKILTNFDLEKIVETNNDWIIERTGIVKRHIADESELTSDLAVNAANNALNKAGLNPSDIDLIIVATTTPDNTFPATAVTIQNKLGIKTATAFDVQAVCAGFIYALATADSLIKNLGFKRALVIGAETMSRIVDWQDRNTCILFGDGAGAVILEKSEETNKGILSCSIYTDGTSKDILFADGGVSQNQKSGVVKMEGREVFKHAVTKLSEVTLEALNKANIKAEEIDWVIPHQANQRILDGVIKKLNIPQEKLISCVADHANTSAASIPLALDFAFNNGKIKKGNLIAMQAIGGGLAWGSVIARV
ncbi:MAG: beta-ketoacyl-ACP synthase III [Rickettsiales bacterium]|nr:beta-ketoacyl-ACP synthase III [Rickettsiales bacterium]